MPKPTSAPTPRRTLRLAEVAEQLGVHERTVARWAADGTLPVVRIGGVVLVRPEDLEAFLLAHLDGGGHVRASARSTRRREAGETHPHR